MTDRDLTPNEILQNCYDVENGGLDVNIQDQTTPPFQFYLMTEDKTDITLTAGAAKNDEVFSVSAGHGFSVGDTIYVSEGDNLIQSLVKSVSTNDIGIYQPIANPFTTSASVVRGTIEMNKNGSVTPISYMYTPRTALTPIDIQTVKITMESTAQPDFSTFGGIAKLANGVYFRRENTINVGYGTYLTNGDFEEFGAHVEYIPKAGGGSFSTVIEFDVKSVFGTVLRMDVSFPDVFKGLVRDDLTTLTQFRTSLIGQYTTGEA